MRESFLLCVLQEMVVPVCVVQIASEWLHECYMGYVVGGSRSTKPCVFPCKVTAAGDERYLVCATGAAGVGLCANRSSYVFCKKWLFLCV